MGDAVSKVRHDYRASKSSGTRPVSEIRWIVIHDAEADLPKTGAEAVGNYFESAASRGSTHYGVDDDSTQQYLPDNVICWGAPGANKNGVHIELMGKASHTRERWIEHHGPMFQRAGWLVSSLAKKYGIPIRVLTVAEFKAGKKGIVTHATVSAADGPGGSTHTDPGRGFPMDTLITWANRYSNPVAVRPVLHRGSRGWWVKRLQKKIGVAADGIFGPVTEAAVKKYQRKHDLKADGIVGPKTWKALGL